jgi:metal-responsive CopG/Arc/MetJ family transcriptional regulator
MKTAISIPDLIFRSAEDAAKRLKLSRSQLYAAAVAAYVERHEKSRVTEQLNDVYADADAVRIEPALAAAQSRSIGRERW